nr:sugar diacid recognition domain-containing protein [uncultured Moellerella sp.]
MLLTEKLANDIATRAMGIIHHNVNVINSQGVIIASGEKKRIGEIHEVAVEVIRCGKRIMIYNTQEAERYTNVAPGINHPIIVGDKVELVIGVSGDPVVIQRYAELAILTAELLIQQEVERRNINWQQRLRDMLFAQFIEQGVTKQGKKALLKLRDSGFIFLLPTIPVIINIESIQYRPEILDSIISELSSIDSAEVLLLNSSEILILFPALKYKDESFITKLHFIMDGQLSQYHIGIGVKAETEEHVRDAVHFARSVIDVGRSVSPEKQVFLFREMASLCLFNEIENNYLFNFFYQICQNILAHDSGEILTDTLEQFLLQNGETGSAALQLNIHRNTLSYRLQQIKKLTALDPMKFTDLIQLSVAMYCYRKRHPKQQAWLDALS